MNDLKNGANRALAHAWEGKKILITATMIFLVTLLMTFFQGVAIHVGVWWNLSLSLIPFFIGAALLLSTGILMIRLYHDEIKQKGTTLAEVMNRSVDIVMAGAYFAVPFVLALVLLWAGLGVFVLLSQTPGIGPYVGGVFAFVPFVLNVAILVLILSVLWGLFYVSPVMALRGMDRTYLLEDLWTRVKRDFFSHLIWFIVGITPLYVVYYLLVSSLRFTQLMLGLREGVASSMLGWFSMAIPFSLFLAPLVIFFFQLAAEAHVALKNKE